MKTTTCFSGLSSSSWPLIGFLYADPVYKAKYDAFLQEVIDGPFNANAMSSIYSTYAALIEPFAISERSGFTFLSSAASFQSAVSDLKSHAVSRTAAVESYL